MCFIDLNSSRESLLSTSKLFDESMRCFSLLVSAVSSDEYEYLRHSMRFVDGDASTEQFSWMAANSST